MELGYAIIVELVWLHANRRVGYQQEGEPSGILARSDLTYTSQSVRTSERHLPVFRE